MEDDKLEVLSVTPQSSQKNLWGRSVRLDAFCRLGDNSFCNIEVQKGIDASVEVVYERDSGKIIKKGSQENIEKEIVLDEKIMAPIEKGQKVGEVRFSIGENEVETVNLIANNEVKKIGTWNMITFLYKEWFDLMR